MTKARNNADNVSGDISEVTAGTGITVSSGTGPAPAVALTTPVASTNGGTGLSSFTTGDIIYSSSGNTLAKLGIGTTSQVLTVASGVPSWAAPASGLTFITGATFTAVSSFDLPANTFTSTYRNYQMFIDFTAGGAAVLIRVRSGSTTYSTSSYEYGNVNINRGGTVTGVGGNADTAWKLGYSSTNARGANVITVYDPVNSGQKITVTGSVGTGDGVNGQAGGMWQNAKTGIDSLNFSIASGTMSGAYRVYGLADA